MKSKIRRLQVTISIEQLIRLPVDAIINDADPLLTIPESWVGLVGQQAQQEVSLTGWCDVGAAVITSAGNLPSKRIIHAVGPRWGDANARGKLAKVMWEILQLAEDEQLSSLAMPPIATGTHGYPIESCANVMLEEIVDFAHEPIEYLREITICVATPNEQKIFEKELIKQKQALRKPDKGTAQQR